MNSCTESASMHRSVPVISAASGIQQASIKTPADSAGGFGTGDRHSFSRSHTPTWCHHPVWPPHQACPWAPWQCRSPQQLEAGWWRWGHSYSSFGLIFHCLICAGLLKAQVRTGLMQSSLSTLVTEGLLVSIRGCHSLVFKLWNNKILSSWCHEIINSLTPWWNDKILNSLVPWNYKFLNSWSLSHEIINYLTPWSLSPQVIRCLTPSSLSHK